MKGGFLRRNTFRGLHIIRVTDSLSRNGLPSPQDVTNYANRFTTELRAYGLQSPKGTPQVAAAEVTHQVLDAQQRDRGPLERRRLFDVQLDAAHAELENPSLVIVILPSNSPTVYSM